MPARCHIPDRHFSKFIDRQCRITRAQLAPQVPMRSPKMECREAANAAGTARHHRQKVVLFRFGG
jgi:hypothetical protein